MKAHGAAQAYLRYSRTVVRGIAVLVLAAMVAINTAEIVYRFTFTHGLNWVQELSIILAMPLYFLAYALIAKDREYIRIEWLKLPDPTGLTAMSIATTCVQPAFVEEFFFRYLILGVLRRHCGVHGAVHVSAAMFAICHVHVLLSMPYLFAVGVFFGYARVASRSMVLPVSLHFLHNLIVTWWEAES